MSTLEQKTRATQTALLIPRRRRRGPTRIKLVRPRPVDAHVGSRMRLRRTMLGMSQEKLAHALGLTFQQVQKYERGTNRVGASRLYELSKILDVPVQFFFDEMPAEIAATARGPESKGPGPGAYIGGVWNPNAVGDDSRMMTRETLELVRAYYRIRNPRVRRKVYDLARSLGGDDA